MGVKCGKEAKLVRLKIKLASSNLLQHELACVVGVLHLTC
jgi:hypothetical protein